MGGMQIWELAVMTVPHQEKWGTQEAGLGDDRRTKRET